MKTTILAEYRLGHRIAIIERIDGDYGNEYRVSTSERFHSFPKAQAAFLSATPQSKRESLLHQIDENSKSPLMR